jgi:L-iditol 2-dehydrogenase
MMATENLIARLVEPGRFEFEQEPIKEPIENQVVIRLIASGICSSEIPFFLGDAKADTKMFIKYAQYPLQLGHETTGQVVAVGPLVERFVKGDMVTGFTAYGSGFATHFVEKESNLIKIPDNVDPVIALGEPLMCAVNILRSSEPEFGENVVIIGDGFMGLLMVQLFSRFPLRSLTLIGLIPEKLRLAKEFGAQHTVSFQDEAAVKRINDEVLGGQGADTVIELAGNQKALESAAWLIKSHRGKLVIPSFYGKPEPFTIGGYLMRKGPRLIPAHPAYSKNITEDLERAIWALENGVFDMEKLITHRFPFEQLQDAFETASSKPADYVKGIIVFP